VYLLLLLLLQFTMREVQGGIIGSGLIVMAIGLTGIIRPVLRAISPITVAANIGVLVRVLAAAGHMQTMYFVCVVVCVCAISPITVAANIGVLVRTALSPAWHVVWC
jgi:hypothetical protein